MRLSRLVRPLALGALLGLVSFLNPAPVFAYEEYAEEYEYPVNEYYYYEEPEAPLYEMPSYIEEEIEEHPVYEPITYETEESETPEFPRLYRTTARLRLRTGPSLYDGIIKTTNTGTQVRVTDYRDGAWFAVEVNGQAGYMYHEFLVAAEALTQTDGTAALREVTSVNGVELLEWPEVRYIMQRGRSMQVTDVRTGTVFFVASFSHGSHADVETLTREDTEAMRRAFGGAWTWTPRPVWITIGERTFAASMSGMPHAGTNNHDNGVNGHFCVHFLGSRTHNGNRSHERDHQNAVQEAFNAAR